MFVGVFSSITPYFIAAGFSVVYLLVSVVQPLLAKNVQFEYSEERIKEVFVPTDSDNTIYHSACNIELEEASQEASNFGQSFFYEPFVKQDFHSHHKFRPNCRFLYTENSVNILTELFFRPPPVC